MRANVAVAGLAVLLAAGPAQAEPRASAAAIDLGTATLDRGEVALGPTRLAVGALDRVMVGTYVVPWSVVLVDGLSVIPNVFVKAELLRRGRISLAVHSAIFYASLDDIDGDGLDARALVWPTQLLASIRATDRATTTLELTAVRVEATAEKLREQDTVVEGVALADTAHVGLVQRWRWDRYLTLWARVRAVLQHAPLVVDAGLILSDEARLRVRARASTEELSSVGAAMIGVLLTRGRANLRLGVGYGHWILPWVQLPVGRATPTGDVSLYWRF